MRAFLIAAGMLLALGPAHALTTGQKIAHGLKTGEIKPCTILVRKDGMLTIVLGIGRWHALVAYNVTIGRSQQRVSLNNHRAFNDVVRVLPPYKPGGLRMCHAKNVD